MKSKVVNGITLALSLGAGFLLFFTSNNLAISIVMWAFLAVVAGLHFGELLKKRKPEASSDSPPKPQAEGVPVEVRTLQTIKEIVPGELQDRLHLFFLLLPELDKLRELVVVETEKATINLTKDIFNLTQVSENVTKKLALCLEQLSRGDAGLGKTAENLQTKTTVFQTLNQSFHTLRDALSRDIQSLKGTVEKINDFSANISDLADQTNILAINASIEAARVGSQGKGFAVIANQVQVLAKNSKEIAEKMAQIVQEVVMAVNDSFLRQNQRVQDAEKLIQQSRGDLTHIVDQLLPQIDNVERNFDEIRDLSQVVSEQLSSITVALQFQDRVRQVLEHMTTALHQVSHQVRQTGKLDHPQNIDLIRQRAVDLLSQNFTMQEEFDTLKVSSANSQNVKETGTVELF